MIYWIYLLFASVMEICWMYSLKAMDFGAIKQIPWLKFFQSAGPILTLLPLVGYIVFGIANVILFASACKGISVSTAFGVWMGVALVGAKLIDVFIMKEPTNSMEMVFMGLVLVGIIGLKISSGDLEQSESSKTTTEQMELND
ncbi:MAG: SMR family transporter [Bacteroidota bacterium]